MQAFWAFDIFFGSKLYLGVRFRAFLIFKQKK